MPLCFVGRARRAVNFENEIHRLLMSGQLDEGMLGKDADSQQSRVPKEIKRNNVQLISQLGKGAFGAVWKAVLDESKQGGSPHHLVAVKVRDYRRINPS